MQLGHLRSDAERLAWAATRGDDPLAALVTAAVRERAWARGGYAGSPGILPFPPEPTTAALYRGLEAAVLGLTAEGRPCVDACACSGGLVELVVTDADRWRANADRLLAASPIHHLRIRGGGDSAALVRDPTLSALTALDLRESPLTAADVLALAENTAAAGLRWLDLSRAAVDAAALAALARQLRGLRWLGLPAEVDPADQPFDGDPDRPEPTPAGRALEAELGPLPWLHRRFAPGTWTVSWELL